MKKTLLTILCLGFMITSCDVDENLNRDTKNPTQVPAEGLFTNGTRNFFDLMHTGSVNVNVFRLYAQYWAQTTYPDESQYNQVTRNIGGNMWNTIYRDVLQDLKGAREILNAQESPDQAKLAQIEFMEVYAYSVLVDIFGNVPYTEALQPEKIPSPVYDDAATIYNSLITRLDGAIAGLSGSGGFDAAADPVYGGDLSKWEEAATSLKLRLAMRLRDQQLAQSAESGNLILDNNDNFAIAYYGGAPSTNPLWVTLVQSGRTDFVGADTFVDVLNSLNDPRVEVFFQPVGGEYIGGVYGSANSPASFSLPGLLLEQPDLDGDIITASEVYFLLAEKEARWGTDALAQQYYEEGVTASFLEWGLSEADATAYLAQADVAWATAPGDALAKIAVQKWIALYNNAFEGWTTWRILDSLPLKAPEAMTLADIPTRFLYPVSEATLNPSGYQDAASAIGGDTKTNTIFWDID